MIFSCEDRAVFSNSYPLTLCNEVGSPIQTKEAIVKPLVTTMTSTHVIVSDYENVYVWQHNLLVQESKYSKVVRKHVDRERILNIHESGNIRAKTADEFQFKEDSKLDRICCICASLDCFFIGCESGRIHKYSLPNSVLVHSFGFISQPIRMQLNSGRSKLGLIDCNNILKVLNVESRDTSSTKVTNTILPFERKDIWSFQWSNDDPDSLIAMEKSKIVNLSTFG